MTRHEAAEPGPARGPAVTGPTDLRTILRQPVVPAA